MNKKQLLGENANLFAEIERKGVELKTSEIKLEEKHKENENLKTENRNLKLRINELEEKLIMLYKRVEELENTPPKQEIVYVEKENSANNAEADFTETESGNSTNGDINEVIKSLEKSKEKIIEVREVPPEITNEQREILKNKAALSIARITKTTAFITSSLDGADKETADRIFSMALGKNESFKNQAANLVNSDGSFEEIEKTLEEKTLNTENQIKSLLD